MTHLVDSREGIVENMENVDDTFIEIRKRLLDEFDTAEAVQKVLKCASKTGDSREPVKVYLRIKPFTGKEIATGESQDCLRIENARTVSLHPPKTSFTFKHQARNAITGETIHRYTFSRVFGPETNQGKFFEDTTLDVVKDFVDGQNCLVFSYGITNAGKTYTILGNPQSLGVLPRTINILFNSFKNRNYDRANLKPKMFCDVVKLSSIQEEDEERKKKGLLSLNDIATYHQSISTSDLSLQDSTQEQCSREDIIDLSSLMDVTSIDVDDQNQLQFSLWISFAEIYNEYIYDLLEPISMSKDGKRTVLRFGNDRKGNLYIKGLTEIHVNNADEALKLLKIGRKNQKIASTKLNENSSRSHCIFTLKILRVVNTKEPHVARVSRLSFVDLAGSERHSKTQNTGVRLKEAGNINTSIMTLGKCVELLRYNQNHSINNQKNIPFRESKLTRLFQGFFSGKGKASMIVNVNQCASLFDETLHALKFSAIAKKVTTVVQQGPPVLPEVPSHPEPPSRSAARCSVVWADGSLATPVLKARVQSEEPEETFKEDPSEEATSSSNLLNYEKVIAALREQLIEERKQKALLEVKIRAEVSKEMNEQLVQIERDYNERMEEGQRSVVEIYEKRMDILTKSVKKRKRNEMEKDDDDEFVSSVILHQEQVRNEKLSERIVELENKLRTIEEGRVREDENAKMDFVEQETQVETQSKEICELKTKVERLVNEICSRDEKIKSMEVKLVDFEELKGKQVELTGELERRNTAIQELLEEISRLKEDSGKVVQSLEKELKSRNENIEVLEKEKVNHETNVVELRSVVEKYEQQIADLEKEISSLKRDNGKIVEGLKEELAEREEKVVTLEKELAKSSKDESGAIEENKIAAELEEKVKKLTEENETEVSGLRKEIEQRNEKIRSLDEIIAKNEKAMSETLKGEEMKDFEMNKLREKVKSLEASKTEECQSLRKELSSRDEQLEQLEKTLKDCQVELEGKRTQLMAAKKVQGGRSLTPTKLGANVLVKQLEKRLEESTAALEKKNSQLIRKNNAIKKLENSLQELRRDLSEKQEELSGLKAKFESEGDSNDVTIHELNAQLKEQKGDLLNKTKEKEEVEENLKFVEGELQILSCKEKENQEEMMKLKEERDEMSEEVKRWKLEVEKHQEVAGNLEKQLQAQDGVVKKQERIIESKEDDLRDCKDKHNNEIAELNEAMQNLQKNFDKAMEDLSTANTCLKANHRRLEDRENLEKSWKDACHSKEDEVTDMKKELQRAHNELRDREADLNELKDKMEQQKKEEILGVNKNWEATTKRMKTVLEEQDEVLGQMEKDLASKEEELGEVHAQVEKLLLDNKNVEKLTKENENFDEQCERYKIKIFELETQVEKLQQDLRKEAGKKDSATQALRDGLEIVKAKKLEYDAKMETAEKETEEIKKEFEAKIADLKQEVQRLKSSSSENDEQTDSTEKENRDSSSGDAGDYVYKPVEVESFNMPNKDRVEIDVTPITGSGLPKSGKKGSSVKTKSLKRTSSVMTLKEIQQQIRSKSAKKENCSEDEFTPVSIKKLRKTRNSSIEIGSKQSKANITSSPSMFSLSTLNEDSENASPFGKSSQKAFSSNKRKFFNKLGVSSSTDENKDAKKRRRKLFKKTEISAPLTESPLAQSAKLETPTFKAQEIITRRLRSRVVKAVR